MNNFWKIKKSLPFHLVEIWKLVERKQKSLNIVLDQTLTKVKRLISQDLQWIICFYFSFIIYQPMGFA